MLSKIIYLFCLSLLTNCIVLTGSTKPDLNHQQTLKKGEGPAISFSFINWEVPYRHKIKGYLLQSLQEQGYFTGWQVVTNDADRNQKKIYLQLVFEDSYHRKIMDSDAFEQMPARFLISEINDTIFFASFFFFPTRVYIDESVVIHVFYKNHLRRSYQYPIHGRGYFSWLSPLFLPFSSEYEMLDGKNFHKQQMQRVARQFISDLHKDRVFFNEI